MTRKAPRTIVAAHGAGFLPEIGNDPACVTARKLAVEVTVQFAAAACSIPTLEGPVWAQTGDAVITGTRGERWPVARARFLDKYDPIAPTLAGYDGRYRSRSRKVAGLQMTESFVVVLPNGKGRLSGEAGDWLVDYGDGSLGVVAQSIFRDLYVISIDL